MTEKPLKDQLAALRWGVTANGVLVLACRSRRRAEMLVELGDRDSAGLKIELADLRSGAVVAAKGTTGG